MDRASRQVVAIVRANAPSKRVAVARSFSSSSSTSSHIGSLPVSYPPSVSFAFPSPADSIPSTSTSTSSSSTTPSSIRITGPRGSLSVDLKPFVHLNTPSSSSPSSPGQLVVAVQDPTIKTQRAIWGLTRSLIANAVTGVSDGYTVNLRLVGVGYRAALEDVPNPVAGGAKLQRLNMKLGFAHPVLISLPPDVKAETPSTTQIVLSGIDKGRLGQIAAQIRSWRAPEPYNGKGIFIGDEVVQRKEIKKK